MLPSVATLACIMPGRATARNFGAMPSDAGVPTTELADVAFLSDRFDGVVLSGSADGLVNDSDSRIPS
jgi:hypothetical protein